LQSSSKERATANGGRPISTTITRVSISWQEFLKKANVYPVNLSDDELERLAMFGLGVALGLVVVGVALNLLREWVIASDLADRERIREVLREMLRASAAGDDDQAKSRLAGILTDGETQKV
jgi:hypothetical protein